VVGWCFPRAFRFLIVVSFILSPVERKDVTRLVSDRFSLQFRNVDGIRGWRSRVSRFPRQLFAHADGWQTQSIATGRRTWLYRFLLSSIRRRPGRETHTPDTLDRFSARRDERLVGYDETSMSWKRKVQLHQRFCTFPP